MRNENHSKSEYRRWPIARAVRPLCAMSSCVYSGGRQLHSKGSALRHSPARGKESLPSGCVDVPRARDVGEKRTPHTSAHVHRLRPRTVQVFLRTIVADCRARTGCSSCLCGHFCLCSGLRGHSSCASSTVRKAHRSFQVSYRIRCTDEQLSSRTGGGGGGGKRERRSRWRCVGVGELLATRSPTCAKSVELNTYLLRNLRILYQPVLL